MKRDIHQDVIDFHQHRKFLNVFIVPDIRIFTFFVALNGPFAYRNENAPKMAAERIRLIADLQRKEKHISSRKISGWRSSFLDKKLHVWWYLFYTTCCGLPPAFEYHEPDTVEDYSAVRYIEGFSGVLAEIYEAYDVENLFRNTYEKILVDYCDIYDEDKFIWELEYFHRYLRIAKPEDKKLIIVPTPFDSHYSGFGAPHRSSYYIFESIGAQRNGLDFHEYLHLYVNPIVRSIKNLPAMRIVREFELNKDKPWVIFSCRELYTFIAENIVRALDHRMRNNLTGGDSTFEEMVDNGLALVPYFHDRFALFEVDETSSLSAFIESTLEDYQ